MKARKFLNFILRILFRILLRCKIEGMENFPREGPVILMINHINFLDPILIGALSPREVMMMAKREVLGYPLIGLFVRFYGVVPIRRGEVDRKALRRALETLAQREVLLIAPEGTRSHHGRLQKAKDGISYIALKTNAVILPVAIWGQEEFFRNIRRFRPTKVNIKIGRPFRFLRPDRKLEREDLTRMTTEAMYVLASLLPPKYRGVYSDLENATTNYIEFLEST
ncbi:MAG: 1-acyl-sn-glycerol-3-phosphate acyltransferase [Chloroflexi bacterium]|nr:MAG: 1-acyl-sn-glycerol-3-phosphate acyltransferase [Chloroflexota bacterium]HDN79073.1 1-acyl-sn-glycerol-3-phosphate acyltransferase [Chloroflexota bacterium]